MSTNEQVSEGTVLGGAGVTSGTDRALVVVLDGGRSIGLPISGTITANQGTPAAVANAWPMLITDGVDTAQVVAALPAANTNALVVRQVPTSGTTSTVSRVGVSAANVTLLALNTARISASFCNNATSANLYVKLGATASLGAGTESFTVKVPAGGFFRLNLYEYSGIVDGIWDTAEAGAECLITEITP